MAKGKRRNRPGAPNRGVVQSQTRTIQRIEAQHTFEGPIPHPAILQQYDVLVPGAADRLIRMAQDEAVHRRDLESRALQSDIGDRKSGRIEARVGQVFGFLIGVTALVCGTVAAVNGAEWFGTIIGTGGVTALVGVFIWGRTRKPATEAAKAQPVPPG